MPTNLTGNLFPRRAAAAVLMAALGLAVTACGDNNDTASHSGMSGMPTTPSTSTSPSAMSGSTMPGMTMAGGTGLADNLDGYELVPDSSTAPANRPAELRFTIKGPDGMPLTQYKQDQTKQLHLYAVRSDLTGFQHVHPTLSANGTWSARLAAMAPGDWRVYTAFVPASGPDAGDDVILSTPVKVPGMAMTKPLPMPATSTRVGGYTVRLDASDSGPLMATFSHGGQPVTDLQPYLDTYAHMTAFHEGDMAIAHLHPLDPMSGDGGGPSLTFHTEFPEKGNWRIYLQFKTNGVLRTAAITLHVS